MSEGNVLIFSLKPFELMCGKLPASVQKAAMHQVQIELRNVQWMARKAHRYMSTPGRRPSGRYYRNTGRLERSVQIHMEDDGGRVYLDLGIALYGLYVHEGQQSWAPDQFIYEAMAVLKENIIRAISDAVFISIQEL